MISHAAKHSSPTERDFPIVMKIYSRILYDGAPTASLRFRDEDRTIFSRFFKDLCDAGWRMVMASCRRLARLHNLNATTRTPHAAFTHRCAHCRAGGDQAPVAKMLTFSASGGTAWWGSTETKGSCRKPKSNVFPSHHTDLEETAKLLDGAGRCCLVRQLPLVGTERGYLRLSYAASMEELEEGVARIANCQANGLVKPCH